MFNEPQTIDFSAIRLKLASPADITSWSHGEITKPETINYRTQKPEKDGLFSERIFGPAKDWECHCGKYKKIRYKGIVCDKCGVEVTRSVVRRERMGHIGLASPVAHIWFLRGVPSKMGIVLDLSVQTLEKILYFANFVITKVNEDLRVQAVAQLADEEAAKRRQIEAQSARLIDDAQKAEQDEAKREKIVKRLLETKLEELRALDEAARAAEKELQELVPMRSISETLYQDLSMKYGHVFEANIGGEAIYELLKAIDLSALGDALAVELETLTGAKRERVARRLKLVRTLVKNGIRPEWMMLTVIPVIPPDLRPMVPLDGGRFATSDLNDLYRRVINRNNRLKQLIALRAPEVIFRNEKRMLQEAVDALIDNSARQGKTVTASTGQKRQLKSIADILKGKQGRFRQNLLGKRVDYSGRSVIVVGPHLKLHQCGLPKRMALELFKPFIIAKLIQREIVHNVRSAGRFIETGAPIVWDILEEVTKDAHVLLNRAPTLHRLGIQAFQPILIEGKAIQIHPMVCTPFNADFDGDQMAVHVPLTEEAKREASEIMLASKNLLKPATGDPVVTPGQDVVWGIYYLTKMIPAAEGATLRRFSDPGEAMMAYELKHVGLQEEIAVRITKNDKKYRVAELPEDGLVRTSVGRLFFNRVLPSAIPYVNEGIDKKKVSKMVRRSFELLTQPEVAVMLDDLKELAFKYLTLSGLSWGMSDIPALKEKGPIMQRAEAAVDIIGEQFGSGLLTESERYAKIIEVWTSAKDEIVRASRNSLDTDGSVFSMIESGARGSWGQLTQMIGMKGLVTNPTGEIIELPVKGSFKEGFEVLEYFISTHGARKGLSDTALRTANAGYLTRRLVDVAQDVVIYTLDCGDTDGFTITKADSDIMGAELTARVLGRMTMDEIKSGRKVIARAGTFITEKEATLLREKDVDSVRIRSLSTCKAVKGVCQACYGYDLGNNRPVDIGVAVGIIAAQSIGEPGTQLTMRTFHTGGVVGEDITQGLPRVDELFEARMPRKKAFLAELGGRVTIVEEERTMTDATGKTVVVAGRRQRIIKVAAAGHDEDLYKLGIGKKSRKKVTTKKKVEEKPGVLSILVANDAEVPPGAVLATLPDGKQVTAERGGKVRLNDNGTLTVIVAVDKAQEYLVPPGYQILVKDGDMIEKGVQLTNGAIDLHELYPLRGKKAVEQYVLREIQAIYSSQGQRLNDKHIELICRQLFSRVFVDSAGDTDLLPGEIIERAEFLEENARMGKTKGEVAEGKEMLLGISKVALSTRSFLSAASFQETARVLINAAITGKIDHLEGLKENVIIGRLIPAGTGFKPEDIVPSAVPAVAATVEA